MNDDFVSYNVNEIPKGIFKASIVPRPIGWVSSMSQSGVHNIAPFSYFNAVCDNPPSVMISFTDEHKESGPKDTLKNIEETGHFVVNIVTRECFEQMNMTSVNLLRSENEFEFANLKTMNSHLGDSLRVDSSPIQLECKYAQSVDLPRDNDKVINRMIIGKVVAIHIDKRILTEDNKIDYNKINIIARLGYNDYLTLNVEHVFSGRRP